MPYFNGGQQGVMLLLGLALLFLQGGRAGWGRSPEVIPGPSPAPVLVEAAGELARPGVYIFNHRPTLAEVWRQAGALPPPPAESGRIVSGSRVAFTTGGGQRLSRMAAPQLLTLGLALDLNQASREDLAALPGIGPVLAERVVTYRHSHGPFRSIADLEKVPGLGPKKVEQVRPFLMIAGQEGSEAGP